MNNQIQGGNKRGQDVSKGTIKPHPGLKSKKVLKVIDRCEVKSTNVLVIKISQKTNDKLRWKEFIGVNGYSFDVNKFSYTFSCPEIGKVAEYADAICGGVGLIIRKRHCRDVDTHYPPKWVQEVLEKCLLYSSFVVTLKVNDKRPLYVVARERVKSFTLNQVIPYQRVIDSLKGIQIQGDYNGDNPLLRLEPEMVTGLLSMASMEINMVKTCSVGRFYCKDKTEYVKTLQDCPRIIRRLTCADNFVDLDMKNSHPVILVQLLEIKRGEDPNIYNMEYHTLQRYVDDRDGVLAELKTFYRLDSSDPLKELLLAIINGAEKAYFIMWNKRNKITTSRTHEIVQKLYFECANIQTAFERDSDHIYRLCIERAREKKKKNVTASALALYIQDIEASIGYVLVHFLMSKGLEVSMLIHDGLLVKKSPVLTEGLISSCHDVVLANVGFDVTLRLKEFVVTDQDKFYHMDALSHVKTSTEIVFGVTDLPDYHNSLEYRLFVFINKDIYKNTQKLKDIMKACVVAGFYLYDWLRHVKETSELRESTLIYMFTKLKGSLGALNYYSPQAVLKKYAKEGQTKEYFERFNEEIRQEIENRISSLFIDEDLMRSKYGDSVKFIKERYLGHHSIEIENVNAWEAPKGGGKTEAMLKNFIERFDRVLCLTIRQSQARDFKRRFNIDSYLDNIEDRNPELYRNKPKLICQLESLHNLRDRMPDDAILIDEIQSILNGLDSETISDNFLETIMILNERLLTTKYVLLCDSDFNTTTLSVIDFLKKYPLDAMFQERTLSIIVNQYNVTNRTLETIGDNLTTGMKSEIEDAKVLWLKRLVKLLKNGKRVFVVCATREMALRVQGYVKETCKGKVIRLYTSKEGDQRDFENIERKWRVQCLVVTTKVTVGLDFSTRWFDQLYMYVSCSENGPLMRHLLQASMRVRYLRDDNVVALVLPKSNFGGNRSRVYRNNQVQHIKNTTNNIWGLLTAEEHQKVNIIDKAEWVKEAFINNRLEREIGIYHTHEYFRAFAKRTGFHQVSEESEDNENIFDEDGIPTNDPSWQMRSPFDDIEDVNSFWINGYKNGTVEVEDKNSAEQRVSKYFLKKMFNLGKEGGIELAEKVYNESYFENTKEFSGGGFKMVSVYLPVIQVLLSDDAIKVSMRTIREYQDNNIMVSAYHPKRMRPIRVKAVMEIMTLLNVPNMLEPQEIPKSVVEGVRFQPDHFYRTFNLRSRFDKRLKAEEMSVKQKINTFNMVMSETIGGRFKLEQKRVKKDGNLSYDGNVIYIPPFENIKELVYPSETSGYNPEAFTALSL
jgi:hypothetical protein